MRTEVTQAAGPHLAFDRAFGNPAFQQGVVSGRHVPHHPVHERRGHRRIRILGHDRQGLGSLWRGRPAQRRTRAGGVAGIDIRYRGAALEGAGGHLQLRLALQGRIGHRHLIGAGRQRRGGARRQGQGADHSYQLHASLHAMPRIPTAQHRPCAARKQAEAFDDSPARERELTAGKRSPPGRRGAGHTR